MPKRLAIKSIHPPPPLQPHHPPDTYMGLIANRMDFAVISYCLGKTDQYVSWLSWYKEEGVSSFPFGN